jgi:threonine/homoserine/homoserine lactone efflux protein
MSTHVWWTFLVAVFLICGAPGPNMLMVMSSSVRYGFRRAFYTMAGCYLAVIAAAAMSVAGFGALLKVEPLVFNILRYAGAAYLVFLGVQAWRAPVAGAVDLRVPEELPSTAPKMIFYKGFLVGISNPKALLFATAFLPQFINPGAPQVPQLLILLVTFSVTELGWYLIYASCGKRLSLYLKRENIRRAFNRLTGGIFITFGVSLLCARME